MREQFIKVSVKEAYDLVIKNLVPVSETEEIDIDKCWGRIIAEDIIAEFDNPSFDRSPYDGYAVNSADIAEASQDAPAVLKVIDEISAGMTAECPVTAGTAVRIMTGAPIPAGADCVVMQEDTDYGEDRVEIYKPVGHLENYSFAGENFRKGQLLIPSGTKLSFTDAGVLGSLGRISVKVYRRPKVAVIATGDEVVMPGQPLPPAKIYNSNMYLLMAAAESNGAEVVMSVMSGDDTAHISKLVKEAADVADIILTSGGISAGKKDLMRKALADAGAEIHFSQIDVRPGGAVTFATIGNTSVVSLSGSPFSAAACFNVTGKLTIRLSANDNVSLADFEGFCTDLKKGLSIGRRANNVVNNGEVVRFD